MRHTSWFHAAGAGMLVILGIASVAAEEEPFVNTPPPPGAICPAIDESYDLCSMNPWSENCADFVSAAGALSQLYLFTVQREPAEMEHLKTSIWWGCGSKHFSELRALLVRINTPKAQAVLQSQPYESLAPTRAAAPAASTPPPRAASASDCATLPSWSEQNACASRQLATARAAHQHAFDACEAALPDVFRSQLIAQERAWKTTLAAECEASNTQCQTEAIRQRDEAMRVEYTQCGAPSSLPPVASDVTASAKTGMLPARWTPPKGPAQDVPFGFEAQTSSTGTMDTTLGKGGPHFHGSYVRVEKSTKGELVTAIYNGWSSPEWEVWKHDPDGQWTATGVSIGDFAHFYTGKVVATLSSGNGSSMRCQFTLTEPQRGLLAGGSGACQISDGGRLALTF